MKCQLSEGETALTILASVVQNLETFKWISSAEVIESSEYHQVNLETICLLTARRGYGGNLMFSIYHLEMMLTAFKPG